MTMNDNKKAEAAAPLAAGRGQFFVNGYRIYKNPNESCWRVEKDGKELAKFDSKAEAKRWASEH